MKRSAGSKLLPVALLLAGAACNVPEPPSPSGGTSEPPGSCGRGVVVVGSKYENSSNISLVGWDGSVLSESLISSASTKTGLSAPLSGDVVMPTTSSPDDRIVLIDRLAVSVLTWVDVRTAAVTGQLSVGTGFKSNPRDYVPLSERKAYVTRFEPNQQPGAEPNDAGNDILIIDPSARAVTGRIPLESAFAGPPGFFPRADRAVAMGGHVYVVLAGYSKNFMDFVDSRLVQIDTQKDSVVDVKILDGLRGCSALALSPSAKRIAVACTGARYGSAPDLGLSGVIVFELGQELREFRRLSAPEFGGRSTGFGLDFASDELLLLTAYGNLETSPRTDALIELELRNMTFRTLANTQEEPFKFGDVRCAAACGVCYLADAELGVLQRFELDSEGKLGSSSSVEPDQRIGLPPVALGGF